MPELHVAGLAAARAEHLPDVFPEFPGSAVQGIGRVVGGERVGFSVELEFRAGDAVAEAAHELAHIRSVREILGEVWKSQGQRNPLALDRQRQRLERAAERQDLGLQAVLAAQRVDVDLAALGKPAESTRGHAALRVRASNSRCKRQKSNSKTPTTILVHHELNVPSKAMRVWMMPRISTPNNVPAT